MLLWIVIPIILLAVILIGLYFAWLIIYPKTTKIDFSYQEQVTAGKLVEADFNTLPKKEFYVPSPYGYKLYGFFAPNGDSRKTVIIAHGITDTLYGMAKYINLFWKRGFNVLLYEHRNHGRSGKKNTTFGYYEKQDLKAILDYAQGQYGQDMIFGTMGESLGAAIVLQHAAIDPRVAFVVADCPYSDLTDLLRYHLRLDYHLPPFPLLNIANFFTFLITGMSFEKVSPIRDIAGVEIPVFWIHGQEDVYIPPRMSVEMYKAKKNGVKKLFLAPSAGHAEAYWNNRDEYNRQIGEFLGSIGFSTD
jgi:uncharacterized protein